MTTQHTPGPYYVGVQNDITYVIAGERPAPSNDYPRHDAKRVPICKVYDDVSDGNAAFIVRACNAHGELLAELKRCVQMLRALAGDIEDGISRSVVHKILEAIDNCETPARAAIAKAEGRS